MPQATNFTIKNGAATPVDKTFTLISPAAGYGGVADWRLKEGGAEVEFPSVTYTARDISQSQRRKAQMKIRVPAVYTDQITQQPALLNFAEANVEITMPMGYPENQKADFIAFVKNSIAHAMFSGADGALRDAVPLT